MCNTTICQPAGDKRMNQRPFSYHETKPYSIWFCIFSLLLLTWFAGNLVAEAKEFADTSSDSKDTMVELVDETLSRANQLRLSGRLEEAAAEWERAFVLDPEYMHQNGAFIKPWVHLFLKLGRRKKALEIYKTGIVNLTCCKQNGTHSPSDSLAS